MLNRVFYINVLYTICKRGHCWTCIIIIHISMSNTIYLRISALTKLNNTLFTNIISLSYLILCELTQWRHIHTNCCDDTSHSTAPCDLTYSCELAHGRRRQKLPMPYIYPCHTIYVCELAMWRQCDQCRISHVVSMAYYIYMRISAVTSMYTIVYKYNCLVLCSYLYANQRSNEYIRQIHCTYYI